jgi:TonB family protein
MGLSSIAVQQREKEVESLRSFLAFSLIGSLGLHIGVLASGIGNFLSRTPELADKPMEVVVVAPPKKVEVEKPKVEPQPRQTQPIREPKALRAPSPPRTLPQPVQRTAPSRAVVTEKQPAPAPPAPIQKPVESVKREVTPAPKPVSAPPPAVPNTQLKNTLGNVRDARASQTNVLTGVGNSPQSVAPATGTGTTNRSSTGTTNGAQQGTSRGSSVATGPRIRQGTPQGRGTGDGDGGVACRNCKLRYPESARRRGEEGQPQVKVDIGSDGKATNVRLTRSSGNAELDKAALRGARRAKFKAPRSGRQGVLVKVDFAIEGSKRHRQLEERKKRREEARKKRRRQIENAAKSPRPSQANAPTQQQRQSPSGAQQAAPGNQDLRDSLRGLRQ